MHRVLYEMLTVGSTETLCPLCGDPMLHLHEGGYLAEIDRLQRQVFRYEHLLKRATIAKLKETHDMPEGTTLYDLLVGSTAH